MSTPSRQHGLLVIARIKAGREQGLTALLRRIESTDVETNRWVPFAQLNTIHFARWALLPRSTDARGDTIPAQLLFASNFDGTQDRHLQELVNIVGSSGLDHIYSHCEEYPQPPSYKSRLNYLRQHAVPHQAFYVGTPGRTVSQIREESLLQQAIAQLFHQRPTLPPTVTASDIHCMVNKFVKQDDRFAWARKPPSPWVSFPVRLFSRVLRHRFGLAVVASLCVAFVYFTVPVPVLKGLVALATAFVAMLRYKESRDHQYPATYSCAEISELAEKEDRIVQNQMTAILNVKPGIFRLLTLKLVLATINFMARLSNQGFLGGIPSIHFARWAIVDNGRRLLFLSNFDGSWENYLDDFIDKASHGLTAIWSNTVGFPSTRWLFFEGARDEQRFKAFARNSQVPTQVWYSAYKTLTVQNINNNSRIRAGLTKVLTERQLHHWAGRL